MNAKYAIILASGQSTRMGVPKALLSFSDSENFMEHLINNLLTLPFEKIIGVVSPDVFLFFQPTTLFHNNRVIFIENSHPEKGRFYSLQKGLRFCSDAPVFIHNTDNPFLSSDLLLALDDVLKNYDFVYPVFNNKGGHPLLISSYVVKKILENSDSEVPLNKFLATFNGFRFNTTNQQVLININTINEYHAIFKKSEK